MTDWEGTRVEIAKILDLPTDGKPDMAVDGQFLYIRCLRTMHKYDLTDMSLAARCAMFAKDGRARGFSIFGEYIFLHDFLDLYILHKGDFQVIDNIRLGADLSSDIGGVMLYDPPRAYVKIRNGRLYIYDTETRTVQKYVVNDSSSWCHCVAGDGVYLGTVKGELIDVRLEDLRVRRRIDLHKKNVYSAVLGNGLIYTLSQDGAIKAVDAASFETALAAKKAVRGMAAILGIHGDDLVVADSGQIALWDARTLAPRERFDFPVGWNNHGVILSGGALFGSDADGVYRAMLA